MHADDTGRIAGVLGELGDGDGRRVAGENHIGRQQAAKGGKGFKLYLRILCDGLHYELDTLRSLERGARRDPSQRVGRLLMADGAFFLQAFQILLDRPQPAGESVVRDIDEYRVPAVLRKHVRDAVAHRTRANHRHLARLAHAARSLTAAG